MKKTTWMRLTATTAMALAMTSLLNGCQKRETPLTDVAEKPAVAAPAVEPAVTPDMDPVMDPAAQKPMDHPAH